MNYSYFIGTTAYEIETNNSIYNIFYIKINNPHGIKRLCLLRYESKAFILYSDKKL